MKEIKEEKEMSSENSVFVDPDEDWDAINLALAGGEESVGSDDVLIHPRKSSKKEENGEESSDIDSDNGPIRSASRKSSKPSYSAMQESSDGSDEDRKKVNKKKKPIWSVESGYDDSSSDSDDGEDKKKPRKVTSKSGGRWKNMVHFGPQFPPPYQPAPKGVGVLYNGKLIELDKKNVANKFSLTAEEAARFFAEKIEQDNRLSEKNTNRKRMTDNPIFRKNFFEDWKIILGKDHVIKDFDKVDFTPLVEYIVKASEARKRENKTKTKAEKEKEKEILEKYRYAIVDGQTYSMNPLVERPGLFLGHGNDKKIQPFSGKIKGRIKPELVTINVSKDSIPKCEYLNGQGCKWGKIVEDKSNTWIASYPITMERKEGGRTIEKTQTKYIFLDRKESHYVKKSDQEKFEKARNLATHIDKIRKRYTLDLKSTNSEERQLAVATYLLDVLAIRPAVDKDEEKEATTLGLTTLKCENVKIEGSNKITINFSGKSSIEYKETFTVDEKVYAYFEKRCGGKDEKEKKSSSLFPRVDATSLNKYLKSISPTGDLTAKVFRTWKASTIFEKILSEQKITANSSDKEKKMAYDAANLAAALVLNHKRMLDVGDRPEKIKVKLAEEEKKLDEGKKVKGKKLTDNQIQKIKQNIKGYEAKLKEIEGNVALGTSKQNYINPQIAIAWAKKYEVPIEKIYNKALLTKFAWAMETKSTWNFVK